MRWWSLPLVSVLLVDGTTVFMACSVAISRMKGSPLDHASTAWRSASTHQGPGSPVR
jgi:hypothetical protein